MNDPEAIAFAVPDITDREVEAVADVIRSRWLTTGSVVSAFENEFAGAVGAPFAVALNSCTAALHLSLEALGVGEGDLVFVPTYTFAATAEVVRYLGAEPVLCDVREDTLNIDVPALRKRIVRAIKRGEGRPAAVMPVDMAGVACDLEEIWDLAREFGLAVVEDAAHAFPSRHGDHQVGWTPADVPSTVCFSFYATKTITTGEGGMVVTRSEEVADRIRTMSLHGLSRQAWNRYSGGTWKYDIVAPGYKYNLTDMAAAMGRVQLERAGEMAERRRSIAERYLEAFADLDVQLPIEPEGDDSSWHLFVLRLPPGTSEAERDGVIDRLKAEGIGVSMHFIPLHLHSYYRQMLGSVPEEFPVALDSYSRAFSLPIWSAMSDDQVDRVIASVRSVVSAA